MKLLPLDTPKLCELTASWLNRKAINQWLDFGYGRQSVSPMLLMIMAQRDIHFLRVYTSDRDDTPIGIVGLIKLDRVSRAAEFWGVAGKKSSRSHDDLAFASSKLLTLAFREFGLRTIHVSIVEQDPSLPIVERLHFRLVGRKRQSHYIDGRAYDRLLFDLVASEHRELARDGRRQRAANPAHARSPTGREAR